MSTWKGYEVLDWLDPDPRESEDDELDIQYFDTGSPVGRSERVVLEDAPAPLRSWQFTFFTLAELKPFRDFLERIAGRLNRFWMPSWRDDLSLQADLSTSSNALKIVRVGYSDGMFVNTGARRHLAFSDPGGAMSFTLATAAADDPTNGRENLTINPTFGRSWSKSTARISFLRLVRLERDLSEIRFLNGATCELVTREVPMEAPTT